MGETKYGKYIVSDPKIVKWDDLAHHPNGEVKEEGIGGMYMSGDLIPKAPFNVMVRWDWDPPDVSPIEPHKHDVDEILLFLAMGPEEDLAAETEIMLGEGEEAEAHTITRTSLVYIPAGLQHGPMNLKNFDKSKRHCCAISFLLQPDYL